MFFSCFIFYIFSTLKITFSIFSYSLPSSHLAEHNRFALFPPIIFPSYISSSILPNSERERMEKEVKTKTVSLWSLILSNPSDFENPLYNPATRHHVLFPLTSMRHLSLWDKYYCRWNPSMRPQVQDDRMSMKCILVDILDYTHTKSLSLLCTGIK